MNQENKNINTLGKYDSKLSEKQLSEQSCFNKIFDN